MAEPFASIPTPYKGLQVKSGDLFPLECPRCHRRFVDLNDYVARTTPLRNSTGLAEQAEADGTFVLLTRSCLCVATLTLACRDRRNRSAQGVERRNRFDSLVALLTDAGIPRRQAETKVRQLLNQTAPELPPS